MLITGWDRQLKAGCRSRRNPDSNVGMDVGYILPALAANPGPSTRLIDGAPVLAVEILSPTNHVVEINEKIEEYLETGVALVGIFELQHQTVMVYRRGAPPQ